MKISLAITTYNRFELTLQSFEKVIDLVDEIVIVDDCSDQAIYEMLSNSLPEKVRLFRNDRNLGMSLNKKRAIELCRNEWVIIFDSDNRLSREYILSLEGMLLESDTIYMPSFAKPNFDYRNFSEVIISKKNIKGYLDKPLFGALLNTCNYLVNRKEYLKTYQYNKDMKGTDTIWFNYNWLKAGNKFYVVSGMTYDHLVHDGSGFIHDIEYNMGKAKEIENLIRGLW